MIFLTDENISPRAAYMLDQFDHKHEVRAFVDYFKEGTPDTEWMLAVASWEDTTIAVSADGRISRNEVERQVLKECELMFVYLAPGWVHLGWEKYAWKIIKAWPAIASIVEQARYPMLFEVSTLGKVRALARISKL